MSKTKIIDASRIEYGDILAFHPGCYLKELIDDMEITQDEFAKRGGDISKTFIMSWPGQLLYLKTWR